MESKTNLKCNSLKASAKDSWGVLAFVFGIVFVQGVVYVTKVGNLYVDIVYPFAVVVLCLNLILRPKLTLRSIESCFYKGMLPFLLAIALSMFLAIESTMTHVGVQISSCINGIIVLLFSLAVYFAVISMRDHLRQLLWGLFAGLLANIAVSFLQYAAFQSGTAFTLYDMFPQPAFYISVQWGFADAWVQNIKYLVYSYRAQGMYLEVSYFVGAATIVFVLAMGGLKVNGTAKGIALAMLLFLFAISNTGNFILFVGFVLISYLVLRRRRGGGLRFSSIRRSRAEWLVLLFAIVAIAAACLYALANIDEALKVIDFDNLVKGLSGGLESSNITNADNQERFQYMQNAISEFARFPWGGGYNMAPTLIAHDYGTNTSFSYPLTLLIELGPLGLIAYLYFLFSMVARLFSKGSDSSNLGQCIAVALTALFAFQTGNGIGLTTLAWCVFALGSIEIAKRGDL